MKNKIDGVLSASCIVLTIAFLISLFSAVYTNNKYKEFKVQHNESIDEIASKWIKADIELKNHVYSLYEMIIDNIDLYEAESLQIRDNINYFVGYRKHTATSIFELENTKKTDLHYIEINSTKEIQNIANDYYIYEEN